MELLSSERSIEMYNLNCKYRSLKNLHHGKNYKTNTEKAAEVWSI